MEHQGIEPQMWYCPLRKRWRDDSAFFQGKFGRPLITAADLAKFFTDLQGTKYAGMDLNWWVPRKLENSTLTFPDASLLRTRVTTSWPSRIDDASISMRPIVSDWLIGSKSTSWLCQRQRRSLLWRQDAKLQFWVWRRSRGDYFCSQHQMAAPAFRKRGKQLYLLLNSER